MPACTTLNPVPSKLISIQPPAELGPFGRLLWGQILSEYDVRDAAGLHLLYEAAACWDRSEALAERIRAEGPVIQGPSGPKSHPACKDELGYRLATVKFLKELGVTLEDLRPSPGRPPQRWRP
jgi:hypothetical protein